MLESQSKGRPLPFCCDDELCRGRNRRRHDLFLTESSMAAKYCFRKSSKNVSHDVAHARKAKAPHHRLKTQNKAILSLIKHRIAAPSFSFIHILMLHYKVLLKYASFLGVSGIAAGAFGAHALKGRLEKHNSMGTWNTAVLYHLIHAANMLSLHALSVSSGHSSKYRLAGNLMLSGVSLFSGSLYGLALELGPKSILGPTTPIGGVLMIASWAVLGLKR